MSSDSTVIIQATNLHSRGGHFSLFVDDEDMGKVDSRQKIFSLSAGRHQARLEFLFLKTNTVEFTAIENEDTVITWGLHPISLIHPVFVIFIGAGMVNTMGKEKAMPYLVPMAILAMIIIFINMTKVPGLFVQIKVKS